MLSFASHRSVVVITCASHAQGPRFEPGRWHVFLFLIFLISAIDRLTNYSLIMSSLFSNVYPWLGFIAQLRFEKCNTVIFILKQKSCNVRENKTRTTLILIHKIKLETKPTKSRLWFCSLWFIMYKLVFICTFQTICVFFILLTCILSAVFWYESEAVQVKIY